MVQLSGGLGEGSYFISGYDNAKILLSNKVSDNFGLDIF